MILLLKPQCLQSERDDLLASLTQQGGRPQVVKAGTADAIVLGPEKLLGPKIDFGAYACVDQVINTRSEYPLLTRESRTGSFLIQVGPYQIGEGKCLVVSGPCAVENEDQLLRIAQIVKDSGAHILRGGAYKPRTSPYKFQGLGREGLRILANARKLTGLPVVTEALDVRDVDDVAAFSDILQIGTRNMQNFPLLKEVGKTKIPVLLKRGMSATIQEWLLAAEYIAEGGNTNIILCERGIRSFDTETRNLLDLSAIPVVKSKSFLPIAIDPSHGTGRRDAVEPMSLAALAAGAHMVMVEVHDQPERALSDGFQALRPEQLNILINKMRAVAGSLGIEFPAQEFALKSENSWHVLSTEIPPPQLLL